MTHLLSMVIWLVDQIGKSCNMHDWTASFLFHAPISKQINGNLQFPKNSDYEKVLTIKTEMQVWFILGLPASTK